MGGPLRKIFSQDPLGTKAQIVSENQAASGAQPGLVKKISDKGRLCAGGKEGEVGAGEAEFPSFSK